jgi:two-component system chemotaxis sensor kinase CheA
VTVKVDLAEFLSAYIAEVDEQLGASTTKLLAIETATQKGERDPRTVRDLYRAMHTIKGLSSMVGVEPVVAISHRLETLLREADRSGGALPSNLTDVLLQGIRVIEQAVRAIEKGSVAPQPPAAFLAALDAVAPDEATPYARRGVRLVLDEALDQKLDAFERDLLLKGVVEGRRALRLDYAPTLSRAAQGLNINTVRERVGVFAEIVRVIPISIGATERSTSGVAFALLLLTARSNEELATAAGVDAASIQSIVVEDTKERPVSLPPSAEAGTLALVDPQFDEPPRRNLLRVEASRVDDAMERLGTLIVTRSKFSRAITKLDESGVDTRELAQIARENARQLRDLRTSILQVRMVPISEILERIPLMLRSVMRATGRQIRLEIEAGGAELDKAVAERIFPAVVHLVRNAVDHGIESSDERVRAGKDPEGTVRITCLARSSTRLELTIQDDGRGIDAGAVARKAGVAAPETDVALLELLCQPGFSTRDEATMTSGRGLGMDIVKGIAVDQLGGDLSMHTQPGLGTRFTLQVPLTVAIVDAFVIECAGERFVVPLSVVEEIMEIGDETLVRPPHASSTMGSLRAVRIVQRRGETLPLYALKTVLGLAHDGGGLETRALVLRRAGEPVGFLFDRVLGQQEAVIRPLVDPLVRVTGISAATDLGDGRPTIVLDLVALASPAQRHAKALSSPLHPALSHKGITHPEDGP